jgi:hypothetical protein
MNTPIVLIHRLWLTPRSWEGWKAARGWLPQSACRHPVLGGRPGKNERPHPFESPHVGHPIHHHVAGTSSADPDKAGRWHAQRRLPASHSLPGGNR